MIVAIEPKKRLAKDVIQEPVSVIGSKREGELRDGSRKICRSRHLAFIPTAWGTAGVVWQTDEETTAFGHSCLPFATNGSSLLVKILTPGLTITKMREAVLRENRECQEVLSDLHGRFHPETVPGWFGQLQHFLQAFYNNELRAAVLASPHLDSWSYWHSHLAWDHLTPFQREVLTVVGKIPHGQVLTYLDVANRIGKSKAVRAVGGAIGSNPWPVLVPCHRVIGSSGKLVGFSAPGGVVTKRRMLEMEGGGLF